MPGDSATGSKHGRECQAERCETMPFHACGYSNRTYPVAGSQQTLTRDTDECEREESNLHVLNGHQVLSLARLPIPPRSQRVPTRWIARPETDLTVPAAGAIIACSGPGINRKSSCGGLRVYEGWATGPRTRGGRDVQTVAESWFGYGRRRSLLLDSNLDLRPPVAQPNITVLPLLEFLATGKEEPEEDQQASEQSFHAFPLHE